MSTLSSVRAQALGFAYPSSLPLFEDVTFHLTAGWTGLVGSNGAGKTTLLQLIRGQLQPTSGSLRCDGTVVWCPQRVDERTPELETFAWAGDRLARRLIGKLKLDVAALERWPTLSPGERKRWQLGEVLWREPEVLLLDEPGNHLDVEGLALLRGALREFHGVGVLVSHDRALLDDVTHATLRLAQGSARLWPQPFTAARALWTEEADARRDAQRETRRKLEKEEHALDQRRRTLAASQKQRSTGARMKNKYDSDARTLGANFRAEMAEFAHASTLRRVERQAGALREELEQLEVRDEAGQALFLRYEPCPKSTVVQFRGDVALPTGDVLVRDVTLQLGRDEHLWIQGPNGRGKSTLLRTLMERSEIPPERRLLLPQELTLEDSREDLELVRALPRDEKGRVLQLVHSLGVEPDQLLRTNAPSPGEGRKLRLALGLGKHAWLAVLDEPTNHLDLPAIERLEAALTSFPGALVLVTHDTRLGAAVCPRTLVL